MKTITPALFSPDPYFGALPLIEKIYRIESACMQAYEEADAESDNENLFLFVCPENDIVNFQNEDGTFSYTKEEMKALIDRFTSLTARYTNLMIVPGTANIAKIIKAGNENDERITPNKNLMKNTAYLFANQSFFKYSKRNEACETMRADKAAFFNGKTGSLFEMLGIQFGIEICADHGKILDEQGEKHIAVQIILSNAIEIEADRIVNDGKNAIVINAAKDFATFGPYSPTAHMAGVWVADSDGKLEKLEPVENSQSDVWLYNAIDLPCGDKLGCDVVARRVQ